MITKIGYVYVPTQIDTISIDKINGISIDVVPNCEPISFEYDLAKKIAKNYIDSDFALEYLLVECELVNGELVAHDFEWYNRDDFEEPHIEIIHQDEDEDNRFTNVAYE